MEVSMIESLFAVAQIRQDCEFFPSAPIPALPDGCIMPEDLIWFYKRAGGGRLCLRKIEEDIPGFWAWTIVPPSELTLIGESANPYQVPSTFLTGTLARFAFLLVRSASRQVDLAIFLGGPHSGKCFRLEQDSLLPGGRVEVVADSFTTMFKHLSDCNEAAALGWLSSGQYISLSQ